MADRHALLVYTDEIYARLVYGAHRHTAFSSLPGMRERTVLLGGFSKSYAMTGWRIGYAAAPADLMNGIAKVHQYGIMCAPTSSQFAAVSRNTPSPVPGLANSVASLARSMLSPIPTEHDSRVRASTSSIARELGWCWKSRRAAGRFVTSS